MRILFLVLALTGCVSSETPKPADPIVVPTVPGPCDMVSENIQLQYNSPSEGKGVYTQALPVTKPVAKEAHYLVQGLDPDPVASGNDRIVPHLARTCGLLRGKWAPFFPGLTAGCTEVYKGGGGSWTPAESGAIGHGSIGRLFPSVECEAAIGTMYWASKEYRPEPGTRFIAVNENNGRAYVLCMGYETGPGSRTSGAGVSTEALYYLKAQHRSVLKVGRARDQKLAYGPVDCKK